MFRRNNQDLCCYLLVAKSHDTNPKSSWLNLEFTKNTKLIHISRPKKVHIEGASETGFKISSIEITDAIKAGLDEPIQPEPEVFLPSA